jgi:transcriptional regulator with PAS, ATPase and Fis domain
VERALKEAAGNKQRAASALQVSYKTLIQKQKDYGLADE